MEGNSISESVDDELESSVEITPEKPIIINYFDRERGVEG
jgi:hypothetical protein